MIAWKMLKDLIPEEMVSKRNESELSITLVNNSRIELKGADNPDSLRGTGVDFLVIDEFGVMQSGGEIWAEIFRPMLADSKGRALFIGTPKGLNAFYDVYQRGLKGEEGFSSHKFDSSDNPYIDPAEIEAMKREMPEILFRQECLCDFLADDENVLIPQDLLERVRLVGMPSVRSPELISCDPSEGGDECVISRWKDFRRVQMKFLHEKDTMKIAGAILLMASDHKINQYAIDSIGLGKGVADRVSELTRNDPEAYVQHIKSGDKSVTPKRFANKRTEMWWKVMELFRDNKLPYPKDEETRRQLSSVVYEVMDSTGKIRLEPKRITRKRLGRSPDRADDFIYGVTGLLNARYAKKIDGYSVPEPELALDPMCI